MPCAGGRERQTDTAALTAHLLSKGLTAKSGKWIEVWHRKSHKFGVWR